ncbi:MAG TPA: phosphotransferase, partial [Casimicrobiaceae bacterium]
IVDEYVIGGQPPPDNAELFAEYEPFAAAMGRALGELHSALAMRSDDPAFAPEIADESDIERWRAHAASEIDRAYAMLDTVAPSTVTAMQTLVAKLREYRGALVDRAQALRHSGETIKTRIHGDFHLGQILVSSGDAIIVDFEGEPHAPLEKRRAKSSPLRDVAGLLRSLDYAVAFVGARDDTRLTAPMREARDRLLRKFLTASQRTFLDAYRASVGTAVDIGENLLQLFIIEKAAYELCYELANRPDWAHVPLLGLLRSVEPNGGA